MKSQESVKMRSTQNRGQVICRIDSHEDRSSEAILLDSNGQVMRYLQSAMSRRILTILLLPLTKEIKNCDYRLATY